MAASENSKSLHVFHASHIVLSSEETGAYHRNFGLHLNICMIFCVLMANCITHHTKCEDPTSIPSPWSGKTGWEWCQTLSAYNTDMVRFSHNMLQQCMLSGMYIFKRPYVHENMHRLRTLTVVWEHVQSCHMNLHIVAGKSVLYM